MTKPVRSRLLVGAAAAGLLLAAAAPAAAQTATPGPGMAGGPTCAAEPRPVTELLPLWFGANGTPAAMAVGEPVAAEADLPRGEPADAETTAALTATAREVFACFDAGQFARAFALMTDTAVSEFGPDQSNPAEDTPEEVAAVLEAQLAGTPVVPAGQQSVVSEARDARLLPDGRAGALFESGGDVVFLRFAREGDRWLLDGIIDVVEQATPEATPPA